MILDDAEITLYKNNVPVSEKTNDDGEKEVEHKKQRPRFKFSMVNIPIGSELVFTPTGIKVKVDSGKTQ